MNIFRRVGSVLELGYEMFFFTQKKQLKADASHCCTLRHRHYY